MIQKATCSIPSAERNVISIQYGSRDDPEIGIRDFSKRVAVNGQILTNLVPVCHLIAEKYKNASILCQEPR